MPTGVDFIRITRAGAMNGRSRSGFRSPWQTRLPRIRSLSRAQGATPVRTATWPRISGPSSGRRAISAAAIQGPMPGTN